jgi:hypothetical protein
MDGKRKIVFRCWVIVAVLVFQPVPALAHFCGPTQVTLKVGESCAWRILADRTETTTLYVPSISGDPGVVSAGPLNPFMAFHGDFIFTGTAPGTNMFDSLWQYVPPVGDPVIGFCFVTIVVEAADTNQPAEELVLGGALPTHDGVGGIEPKELRAMLDEFIPQESKKLLVLGQCFAGNFATSEHFANAPNISVASATSRDQLAYYGGYHDDAARDLKPGPGRTALDMHRSGHIGKQTLSPSSLGIPQTKKFLREKSEWPLATGGLSLSGFSLESVTSNGTVRSRHVVVYMGQPEIKEVVASTHNGITIPNYDGDFQNIDDNADRDAIKQNFANEINTTVRTVGGKPLPSDPAKGQNGWDLPGDEENLKKAIKEAGDAIRAAPDPAAEQFILFVGDHGQQYIGFEIVISTLPGFDSSTATEAWSFANPAGSYLQFEAENIVHFDVEIIPAPGGSASGPPANGSFGAIGSGDFEIELRPETGSSLILSNFTMHEFDLDGDGVIGSLPGEATELFFTIAEHEFLNRFEGVSTDIIVHNHTAEAYQIQDLKWHSGAISKPFTIIPQPRFQSVKRLITGEMELIIYGPPGEPFMLQASSDGMTWSDIRVIVLTEEVTTILEPVSPSAGELRYRLDWLWP